MKAIVLAGGLGTRLAPLTNQVNKHLLPLDGVPMIYRPLQVLVGLGFRDAMVVVGRKSTGTLVRQIGEAKARLGFSSMLFGYQEHEDGIVGALLEAAGYADGQRVLVILGDQVFSSVAMQGLRDSHAQFCRRDKPVAARVLLTQVDNPQAYGVPRIADNRIVRVDEKPKHPSSHLAVLGAYWLPAEAWELARTIKKSKRGQFEITSLLNFFADEKRLDFTVLPRNSWIDPGESIEAYRKAQTIL